MFERYLVPVLSLVCLALALGFGIQTYRHTKLHTKHTALEAHTATLAASRDKVRGMYEQATIKLEEARRTSAIANKEYTDAVKNDEASRGWADTALPERLRNSLR